MKRILITLSLTFALTCAGIADASDVAATLKPARKACAELRQEIAAKIEANGVKQYQLDIVAPDAVGSMKVVGSCDGGSQRIVYQRGAAAAVIAAVP